MTQDTELWSPLNLVRKNLLEILTRSADEGSREKARLALRFLEEHANAARATPPEVSGSAGDVRHADHLWKNDCDAALAQINRTLQTEHDDLEQALDEICGRVQRPAPEPDKPAPGSTQ